MSEDQQESGSPVGGRPIWLWAVALVALALHGLAAFTTEHASFSNDEKEYIALAKSLADDGRFMLPTGDAATRMPLFPTFLSLAYRSQEAKYWMSAVDILQAGMGVLSAIGLACIASRLGGSKAGIVTGLTAAFYAPFIYLESQLLTETLALLLLVLAMWLYVAHCMSRVERIEQRLAPFGVSVLLGLALLTRANAALFVIPFVVHAFARAPQGARKGVRVLAIVLPAALIAGGWMVRNQAVVGKFSLSTIGGLNFYLGHNPDYREDPGIGSANYDRFNELRREGLTEAAADARLFADGIAFAKANPGEVVANWGRKLVVWFTPMTRSQGPLLLLLVSAVIVASLFGESVREGWRRARWPLVFVWGACAMAYAVWAYRAGVFPFVSSAYLLPLGLPALFLFRPGLRVRGLFIGLLATQVFVALAFIPIVRLRWVTDALLIVALGVLVANVCNWMRKEKPKTEIPKCQN